MDSYEKLVIFSNIIEVDITGFPVLDSHLLLLFGRSDEDYIGIVRCKVTKVWKFKSMLDKDKEKASSVRVFFNHAFVHMVYRGWSRDEL